MSKRIGQKTVAFDIPPAVISSAAVAGKSEKNGPFGDKFDETFEDDRWGEKTYELAERKMLLRAIETAIGKAGLDVSRIDYLLGGDLLNQIISIGFAARQLGLPFFGLYGACSTMAESLILGAMVVGGGFAQNVVCATSSHFATAERQFRMPLELGTPKTPTAQNTATAAGAAVVGTGRAGRPVITHATAGSVVDPDIKDVNNMGAAMAPAAAQTIITHLQDLGRHPNDYDAIITGDLGTFGSQLLIELCDGHGVDLSQVHEDCGALIYGGNPLMHCGGSGCGCSASLLSSHYLPLLNSGQIHRVLFVATGALHSPTSALQGESVPGIAHAVSIESGCIQ